MNNRKKIYFFASFPFPLFSLKHRGVGGLQAVGGCGITGMFTTGRGGGYQAVEVVSRLPMAMRGFQRRNGELGRLEEAMTGRVFNL